MHRSTHRTKHSWTTFARLKRDGAKSAPNYAGIKIILTSTMVTGNIEEPVTITTIRTTTSWAEPHGGTQTNPFSSAGYDKILQDSQAQVFQKALWAESKICYSSAQKLEDSDDYIITEDWRKAVTYE